MKNFSIVQWSCWAPEMNEDSWEAWAQGQGTIPLSEAVPPLEFLPSQFKRRLSQLSKMVLHVGHQVLSVGDQIPMVFASSRGEVNRQADISLGILDEGEVSPASFSLSVFNTPVSLLSIALKNTELASAVVSGESSLQSGLLEALMVAETHPSGKCVFLLGDELLPEVYRSQPAMTPFAVSLLLDSKGTTGGSWEWRSETSGPATPSLELVRWLVKGARGEFFIESPAGVLVLSNGSKS